MMRSPSAWISPQVSGYGLGIGAVASLLGGGLLTLLTHRGTPPFASPFLWLQLGLGAALCFFLFAVWYFRLWSYDYNDAKLSHRVILLLILMLPCGFALLLHSQLLPHLESALLELVFEDEYYYYDRGVYPEMLDAWLKGQLHLDLPYDPAPLEALQNPYSWEERSAMGVYYPWDRAFYNGKFYSYFGVAPLLLLYLPLYALTGLAASETLACLCFCLLAILAMAWLLWELCQRALCRIPLLLYGVAVTTLPCAALLYCLQSAARFYQIAFLCAIACLCGAFAAFLRGCRTDSTLKKRNLWFFLSGLMVALTAASLPNQLLYFLLLAVFAVPVLTERIPLRKKLYAVLSFALPVAVGGGLLMLHNYLRFDSVFEFGSSYQLTIADMRTAGGFDTALLYPSFYHYFLQAPQRDGIFPFVHYSFEYLKHAPDIFYLFTTVGALQLPLTWGMLSPGLWLSPFRKERRQYFVIPFVLIALLLTVIMGYLDTCLAGVHQRYLCDILFLLVLLGAFGLILGSDLSKKPLFRLGAAYVTVLICLGACAYGLALTLENETMLLADNDTALYRFFQFCYN